MSFGGYLVLRVGIINIGLEGAMLAGCFGAVVVDEQTGSAWLGMLGGAACGLAASALFGLLAVTFKANPIIVGLALNFLAAGATALALQAVYHARGAIASPEIVALPRVGLPVIDQLPWLGRVLSDQTVLTYATWALGLLIPWWLAATRAGLTLRVAGVRPDVVVGVGRSVVRMQWIALSTSGVLIGLGGAHLALGESAEFAEGMTAGRGFIALVLIIVVGSRAWQLLPLAIAFALFDTLGLSLQTIGLPSELSSVIPYLAILLLLLVPHARRLVASPRHKAAA